MGFGGAQAIASAAETDGLTEEQTFGYMQIMKITVD